MENKNTTLEHLRSVKNRLLADGSVVSRLDDLEHQLFPVSISQTEGLALRNWICRESVASTIEIGLAYGLSALFACEGLLLNGRPNPRHVVVDPFQLSGYKNCGLQLLEEAGVIDIVEHFSEESQLLLPQFLSEGRTFDMAFVDGSHFFERVFLDLIYLGRLVQPGGIIFVDDYQLPAIARAVSFCVTNLAWKIEEVSSPDEYHQWSVLRIPREPVPRTFQDFVDF